MASSMNTCLLFIGLIASSYLGHVIANSNTPTSISLTGKLFCTFNGNPDQSCGNQSCPPAVNATVVLAVQRSNIVLASTTTSATGNYQINIVYNATNPAPITGSQVNNLVVYINLPVANCTALFGAGLLVGILNNINQSGVVTSTPIFYIRF